MAKHQLIIPENTYADYPVRSEAGQLKEARVLVVNKKGTWAPNEHPEQHLVVAPGDELELVVSSERHQGASLWLFKLAPSLFQPVREITRQEDWERVDIQSGSMILEVNPTMAHDSGESRYGLRVSALGESPTPILGQGNPGTLTASKP